MTQKYRLIMSIDYASNASDIRNFHHIIPHSQTAKYLGMTLDAKLGWKVHVKKKREELGLKYRHVLAHVWKIGPGNAQQPGTVQTDLETSMDLWHSGMGVHKTEQHCYHPEISKQSTQGHR
jgi:hypothetical protein